MSWLSTTYFSQPMGKGEITSKSTIKQIRLPQTDELHVQNYCSFVTDLVRNISTQSIII